MITAKNTIFKPAPGKTVPFSIRKKLVILLLVSTLLPVLFLGTIAYRAIAGIAELAIMESGTAVEAEAIRRLSSLVNETARRDDLIFARARSDALALAHYAAYLYRYPELFPDFLRGGTPLVRTPQGHLVNDPATPVGVFVPRSAPMPPELWEEVGLISHIDPLMSALYGRTPHITRLWIITSSRITRMYPNPGLGHAGSAIGPDYDLTQDLFFTLAHPEQNPDLQPVWTPTYTDPLNGSLMVTAAIPISTPDGTFLGVTGADLLVDQIVEDVFSIEADLGEGSFAFLVDNQGQLVIASQQAQQSLRLNLDTGLPGQAVRANLGNSTLPDLAVIKPGVWEEAGGGILTLGEDENATLVAYALLPATGWTLFLAQPKSEILAPSSQTVQSINNIRNQLLFRGLGGLLALQALILIGTIWAARLITSPFSALTEGTRQIAAGQLAYRSQVSTRDELGLLASEFNDMAERLQQMLKDIETHARERQRAEESRDRAVLEERNRFAREIHDTLAQDLVGIIVQIQAAADALTHSPAELSVHLNRAEELARLSLAEARRSVWNLRPQPLQDGNLHTALQKEVERLRELGFQVFLQIEGTVADSLPPRIEPAFLRIAQEALANARAHSQAVNIRINLSSSNTQIRLLVEDDGRGFSPEQVTPTHGSGLGLQSMQERAEEIGGCLTIDSVPNRGTRVEVTAGTGNCSIGQI